MPGKVFVSCGQRGNEKKIAEKVGKVLEAEFGLQPYLAFRIQSFEDIMTITRELESSDYYLFIDFRRDRTSPQDFEYSLFTHQELALAHHLGFEEIIALQEEGTPREGFLKYILSNPENFSSENELLDKLRKLITTRAWSPGYSRNLIVSELGFLEDGEENEQLVRERWFRIKVYNSHPLKTAEHTLCRLDQVQLPSGEIVEYDQYMHWIRGTGDYETSIRPKSYNETNIFSIISTKNGIEIDHSGIASYPNAEEITPIQEGDYIMSYRLIAQGFPSQRFKIKLNLKWEKIDDNEWIDQSSAMLVD